MSSSQWLDPWGDTNTARVASHHSAVSCPSGEIADGLFSEHPADLLVSVIPHFNREIAEAWTRLYPDRPFVTLITDLADFPPRFWIEPSKEQYVICGTEKAVAAGPRNGERSTSQIFATSGMIFRPDFYAEDKIDPVALRRELGLQETCPPGFCSSVDLARR